ncbi:LPS biosynthesis protein [Gallibacterium salpingitidis]|uniref:LPS assembly protein LptD n=1 Tax=Gallibacterium salpingitidis TaxID=505341 RepID=UPI000804CFCD|nr:LPS assembly protein LptD [Gallibacterium salpingitidis]OBX07308.1 LPS biosynthesis protein [Gallibacterium salpingitidis]
MKKYYSFLSLSILSALYSQTSYADLTTQCLLGVPHFTGEVVKTDPNELPVYIDSDQAEINQPNNALYKGNVQIEQGNRKLQADSVFVEQKGDKQAPQRYAYVNGNMNYQDNLVHVVGEKADIHLNSQDANIYQSNYQFVDRQGRGDAEKAELRQDYRLLKNATFTSCLPNNNSWKLRASEMKQHVKEEYADLWNAVFYVKDVPIFYFPYMQFPIGDRRRSGLLMPDFGTTSTDGYYYAQPIYLNLAPNYDMTVTPKYMSRRGWQLLGEARYLNILGSGTIAGEYIKEDRYDDYQAKNKPRYLFFWRNGGSLWDNWRFNVNYTKVSDRRYFNDFTSPYGTSTDGYATQSFALSYYQPNYNLTVSATQFQVFDTVSVGPYRTLPQIDFNYYRDGLANDLLDFSLYSQAVQFKNDSDKMPTAWRFHMEPTLTMPLANRYGSLNLETKLYATHYSQKKGTADDAAEVESSVNRVIPQFKAEVATVLASNKTLFDGYTQTIEPKIQYVYRPYRDQSQIGTDSYSYLGFGYDSILLQQDFYSLFNDRRYSGLDRIASANQITIGGTTRFFDKNAEERFNLSLGQILYLTPSRIDDNPNNKTQSSSSSWAAEANWKISDKWSWKGGYQYDTLFKETSLMNTALEYRPSAENLIQLSYRYVSEKYIDQNLTGSNVYNQKISQVGMATAWQINDNWAVVGHVYQDISLNKPVEQYIGIEYRTCCWKANVGARRYLTAPKDGQTYSNRNDTFYKNSFGINFEISGLGSRHGSSISKMLGTGIIPYTSPFSLR